MEGGYEGWADLRRYLNRIMAEGDGNQNSEQLQGAAFLQRCMQLAGVTDEEIRLFESWGGFSGAWKEKADEEGFKRAEDLIRMIIEYRDVTLDEVRYSDKEFPWECGSGKSFYAIRQKDRIPTNNSQVYGVYCCMYKGKQYYFGIGKEEPVISKDMLENGLWFEYTWDD